MKRVARHMADPSKIDVHLKYAVEGESESLAMVRDHPNVLDVLAGESHHAAVTLAALGGARRDILRHLVICSDVHVALFKGASESGRTYRTEIESVGEVEFPVTGVTGFTSVGHCVEGICVSIIARKSDNARFLGDVDGDLMVRSSSRAAAYLYIERDALSALLEDHPESARLFREAAEAFVEGERLPGKSEVWTEIYRYARLMTFPSLQMGQAIAERNDAGFNDALVLALQSHRDYHVAKDNQTHPNSLIALEPLAMATLAFERGMRVDVESEYIPAYLYKGEWGAPSEQRP